MRILFSVLAIVFPAVAAVRELTAASFKAEFLIRRNRNVARTDSTQPRSLRCERYFMVLCARE
jgi:hypothetical protein